MDLSSFLRLVLLAAIWGGSFLFMRVAANTFGPAFLVEARVGFAALSLLVVAIYLKRKLEFTRHWRHFMVLGLFNSALPFLFFGYAAQSLTVSTLSILNSTAPMWGALIGYLWHRTPLTPKSLLGMAFGICGVTILVGPDFSGSETANLLPLVAGALAAGCYGLATNYTKIAPNISSFNNAHGSMWAATIWLLPLLAIIPMRAVPSAIEISSVIALGVICTGIAFLLYFGLVERIGPTSTLTVTFMIPIFGILWGYLILDEPIGMSTLIGTSVVLVGTMLVTGFSPKKLFSR
ncbi:DMT family transporter [Vibrio sp. SCSIO 43136]|uniref:DMT family transporter n=1 Tax=Vibrio sp. SCSIO 43136 TaxID=2819101 RepID=UPI00207589A8|nr:DMT family transporter [Vibrio sp. SCSIO 43136]USD67934.1 DMT family transporter [Vibrio sp. SCSIO 43136]